MFDKLQKRIRQFVDIRVRLLKDQQRLNAQQQFNYNQLSQLFKEESFIPFSAWAISPSTILHVLNDILINKKKTIIEFGAGASTFYIAKLLKTLKMEAAFYSVESDGDWVEELQRQLAVYNLQDFVKIVHAPLSEINKEFAYKKQKAWYDIEILKKKLENVSEFDLVLVDGPVGASSAFARYSAVPYLKLKLAEKASIYLDDVNRKHEQEIIEKWNEVVGGQIKFIERYAVLNRNSAGFDVTPFKLEDFPF